MSSGDAGPSVGGGLDAADSAMPEDLQPRGTTGKRFITALLSFAKCLGALLPVYLAGYFGLSISLVLFGLAVYMGWKHHRDAKQTRLHSAMYLMENEKGYTTTQVFRSKRDLPAWVNFPDVEKVEWLNKILQQAWPFVGQYLEKLLVETVAPSIRASSAHLQTFSFTKVNLGDKPMKVVGVKAHTEHDKRQVLLDIYISYAGDVEINVDVKKYFCRAGVKGIQLHGKMRVILEPLIGDVPLVGAITMFFIRRPKLDINWTGLTNLLDIPGLSTMSDTMVMDAISSFLVLPNRLTVPLVADLHVAQLRSPLPRGIVRIHLLEAENLAAKDNYIKGVIAGKSDPYALLRVGTQVFTSHHVDNNLNPQWREMYEVIVHEVPGQELEVEVFDKDPDQDDFLGRYSHILLLAVWFTLKDAPTGKVHLRLEWLSLLSSAERLSEVLQKNQNLTVSSKTTYLPSAAILTVYLDRAQDLPMKKGNKVPSPMVQLSIQDATKESKTVYGTSNPVWEDAFTFFIHDPRKQDLDIQVKDDDRSLTLGTLSIPLSRLLSVADLSMDQWFQLDKSGPASRIYMNIILRVISLSDDGEEGVIPDLTTGGTCILPTPTLPEHTSPDSSFAIEGVLRIHLVEAHDLVAKDSFMGGMMKGKSDPYMKIQVGGLTFKSHVIKENLNPVWNELYEVILTALPGQEVQFNMYDKDLDQDDFLGSWGQPLGSVVLPVKDIMAEQALVLDRWLTLDGALPESQLLIRAELKVTEEHTHTEVLSCILTLICGQALPCRSKDGLDPYVSFILQPDKNRSTKRKTNVKKRDLNPEFNERFYFDFSLEDAMQRHLDLSVKNSVSFLSRERELIGKVLYLSFAQWLRSLNNNQKAVCSSPTTANLPVLCP
uniref:Extended synaptotagmin-like protein 1a n=1 Tax=Electrophorus electricus TaxID=8005 RepID=A0A4W4HR54_ELEEL